MIRRLTRSAQWTSPGLVYDGIAYSRVHESATANDKALDKLRLR